MTEHEAETKWYDAGAGCLFGKLTPAEWDLYLIADRKTWPEDE